METEDRGPATENPCSVHPNGTGNTLTVTHNEPGEAPNILHRLDVYSFQKKTNRNE